MVAAPPSPGFDAAAAGPGPQRRGGLVAGRFEVEQVLERGAIETDLARGHRTWARVVLNCSRRGPLVVRDALEVATGLAEALAAAHAHGVRHRDVSPRTSSSAPARPSAPSG